MADASQYVFSLREVTTALIKQQGLHEGRWMLSLEFSLGAGNLGPSPEEARPAAIVTVAKVTLQKLGKNEQPAPLSFILDAAEVNPK